MIVTKVGNGINHSLSTLPVQFKINGNLEIAYGMTASPVFNGNYLALPQNGEFYNPAGHTEAPFNSSGLPDHINEQQLQMTISDSVPSSAAYVFFTEGKLVAIIQDSSLPPWSPVRLNTTQFQDLIPEMYKKWPNALMELKVYATQTPYVLFTPTGAVIGVTGNIEVNVYAPSGKVNAFTIGGKIELSGAATLNGLVLYGSMTYIKGQFKVVSSNIGPIDLGQKINGYLNELFEKGLVPLVNLALKTGGIPLPTINHLTFVSPRLGYGYRYLFVSTNLNFSPPLPEFPEIDFVEEEQKVQVDRKN